MVDNNEFEEFVRQHEPRLRRALVGLLGPRVGRETALDVLVFAWTHFERIRTMSNPTGYLYRVAQNSAKAAVPRDLPVADLPQDPASTDGVCLEPRLAGALGNLSDAQRSAVILVNAYGYTVREAAEVLGVSPSTVQRTSRRGLANLANYLKEPHDVT